MPERVFLIGYLLLRVSTAERAASVRISNLALTYAAIQEKAY
jgi:hypothetical protein